jgi:hypothetical protein
MQTLLGNDLSTADVLEISKSLPELTDMQLALVGGGNADVSLN